MRTPPTPLTARRLRSRANRCSATRAPPRRRGSCGASARAGPRNPSSSSSGTRTWRSSRTTESCTRATRGSTAMRGGSAGTTFQTAISDWAGTRRTRPPRWRRGASASGVPTVVPKGVPTVRAGRCLPFPSAGATPRRRRRPARCSPSGAARWGGVTRAGFRRGYRTRRQTCTTWRAASTSPWPPHRTALCSDGATVPRGSWGRAETGERTTPPSRLTSGRGSGRR
mmetsp:Transcript_5928/g.24483  ORF Transcript_5928/g.24483 Transcript_5928/m.24483 type:complete len:226 (-) Transcript_5928:140-817(-)